MKQIITTLCLLISANGFAANAIANGSYDVQDSAALRQMDRQKIVKTADTETTRQIRQAIMKDPALSTEAQNIKIITQDGKVTLRGAMSSTMEINSVVDKARGVAGISLEIGKSILGIFVFLAVISFVFSLLGNNRSSRDIR